MKILHPPSPYQLTSLMSVLYKKNELRLRKKKGLMQPIYKKRRSDFEKPA